MKVIAMYLPQYHRTKENDEWWGEGYTEWVAVKKAKPQYKMHKQPRVPLDENYYDLSDEEAKAWAWQAELARKYDVYGFCIYHYWFETGVQLLEKPMEILLRHKEIDINFCVCWANETWTRTWYGLSNQILREQKYGGKEEWKSHYEYLAKFFKDERYIKIGNKPMVNIYHSYEIPQLGEMISYWNMLAKEDGFEGVYIVSGNTMRQLELRENLVDAFYNFEPGYTMGHKLTWYDKLKYVGRTSGVKIINKFRQKKILEYRISYKLVTKRMKRKDRQEKDVVVYPGAFPRWDNTPRRDYKATEFAGDTIDEFKKQLSFAKKNYPDAEFVYINAWNEWGEGAYLEPDTTEGYKYLEAIKCECGN